MKQIFSYGGGTNSAGAIVGLWEHGERPDFIVFCDTGSEKPYTYEHIALVSAWCKEHGFPEIKTIRGSQPRQIQDGSLESECLRLGCLPSRAMGFGACSVKWKIDPFNKWMKEQGFTEKPMKLIGFDFDEPDRADRAPTEEKLCKRRYPLMEWQWGRSECMAAIDRAGLPQPGKSACFFCPSSKKHEILALREIYPDLLERALEIERRALTGVGPAPKFRGKGLGRSFSWAELIRADTAQICMFTETVEAVCECYDGN